MNKYDQWLRQQSQPTIAVTAKASTNLVPIVINIALAAVVAWLLFSRTNTPGPGPGPMPIVAVAEEAEAASKRYAANLAKVCTLMAVAVEDGKLKSRADALEFAKTYATPARTNAFAPIDVMDNAHMPEGEWGDPAGIAYYLREKAKGHERAAR